jgi:hypothetical protein
MNKTGIGVVGVPGSGKSRFASALKRALPEYNFSIIDGYAEKLSEKLKMAVGVDATYLSNVHVSSLREQEIRKNVLDEKNFIVCGTMFDTLCYSGFHAEIVANTAGNQESINGFLAREMTAAQMFAYLAIDTYSNLSHLFYLPITDPELLVAVANKENAESFPGNPEILDKTIQDALRRYGSPATILNDKHGKNVQQAIEIIKSGKNGTHADANLVSGE